MSFDKHPIGDLEGPAVSSDEGLTRHDLVKRTAAVGAALALPSFLVEPAGAALEQGRPRRGGRLRAGYVGGGTSQTLDPNNPAATIEGGRTGLIYDRLVRLNYPYVLEYRLARSFEPYRNRPDEWIIRLRRGVTWHDGSPFTADDVLYTLNRVRNPKNGLQGRNVTDMIDFPRVKKLDRWTLRIPLKRANSEFPYFFWDPNWNIVKNGTTDFNKPNGTGPFVFDSWTPGQRTLVKRNPNYWEPGVPYVDEVALLEIPDQTARLNALLSGQIDWMESPTYTQVRANRSSRNARMIEALGQSIIPIYMAVTLRPFRDVRVRQAMRLIADRPALVQAAQLGFGDIGNDLFGKGVRFYHEGLPQRRQDIDRAKSLLRAAGQSDLRVTLYSSNVWAGVLESATVFAQQAKKAGVTISVKNVPSDTYFGSAYLKQNFAQSLWFGEPLITHYAKNMVRNANYPETHWGDSRTQLLYNEILATLSPKRKRELFYEFQRIQWNEGGYLIWGSFPGFSGVSNRFRHRSIRTSASYFAHAWLAG